MFQDMLSFLLFLRINRNILECKSRRSRKLFRQSRVLIETYWNVNVENNYERPETCRVLIETYWNVNS